jgi:hypothetical protein
MAILRKHRRWATLFQTTGFGLLLLFLFFNSNRSPCVSLEDEEQIQFGMTEKQAVAILAAPPGDYRTRTVLYGGLQRLPTFHFEHRGNLTMKVWTTNDGEMKLWFDQNGQVAGKVFNERAVSVGWLESKLDSMLTSFGLRQPRVQCLN